MAATAAETAAITSHRQHLTARSIVSDGFIFDGSDIHGGNNAVREVVQPAVSVDMRLAEAALTMAQPTTPQTQIASNRAIGKVFLEFRWNQSIRHNFWTVVC